MTTETDVLSQLSHISSEARLEETEELVKRWTSLNVGVEAVGPILRFMEAHPDWDFGLPGPLVHFVERFYGRGYEALLLESIDRKPTTHTAWMLNRLINGEKQPQRKRQFLDALARAKDSQVADAAAASRINHFLSLHS